jgi:hypothetical protein
VPDKVSVDVAIRRGRRAVMYPSLALLLLPLLVGRVVMQIEPRLRYGPAGLRLFVVAFAIGFTLGWVSWSWLAPRWRVWAYARVEDVEELKQAAVDAKLVWPEDHVFSRTEIRPAWLRAELDRLDLT